MKRISFGAFIATLILFVENETVNGKSCLSSMPTLRRVDECPKSQQAWNEASAKKRCDMLAGTQQCASFVYHCLLNQWGNVTVEVCAPTWFLSGFCAMYNTDESRVIDNFNLDCNDKTKIKKEDRCPSRYISTDAYKYQICYRKREIHSSNSERQNQSNIKNENISGLTIVFIVLFIVALAASVFQAVLLYRVGCYKIWKKGNTGLDQRGGDNLPPEVPDIEGSQGNAYRSEHGRDHGSNEKDPLLEKQEKTSEYNPEEGNAHRKIIDVREEERKGVVVKKQVQKVLEEMESWNRPTPLSVNDDKNKKNTAPNITGTKDKESLNRPTPLSVNDDKNKKNTAPNITGTKGKDSLNRPTPLSVNDDKNKKNTAPNITGTKDKDVSNSFNPEAGRTGAKPFDDDTDRNNDLTPGKPTQSGLSPNKHNSSGNDIHGSVDQRGDDKIEETNEKTNASTQMQQEEINKGTDTKDGKGKTVIETDEKTNASKQEEVNNGTETKDNEDEKETVEKPNGSTQMQQEDVNKCTETKDDEDKKESTGANLDKPRDEKSTYPERGHVKRQIKNITQKLTE